MSNQPNHLHVEGRGHRRAQRDLTAHHLELIGRQLRANARLFDDSGAYLAGVEDCLSAVARTLGIGGRRIDSPEADEATRRMI